MGKPLSGLAGLLTSTSLVAVMTVWATSSPFSPLNHDSRVDETTNEPVPMRKKVKAVFALSDSILPSPTIESAAYEVQQQSPMVLKETTTSASQQTEADELTRLEKAHALQQEDRSAWRSFHRQESKLVAKPIVRALELPLRENVAMKTSDLPEVHFASAVPQALPQALPLQIDNRNLKMIPRLPTQLRLAIDNDSIKEQAEQPKPIAAVEPPVGITAQQPAALVATLLDEVPYIAPLGDQNTTPVLPIKPTERSEPTEQSEPIKPSERSRESWETGLY